MARAAVVPHTHDLIDLRRRVMDAGWQMPLETEAAVWLNSVYRGRYPTEDGSLPHGERGGATRSPSRAGRGRRTSGVSPAAVPAGDCRGSAGLLPGPGPADNRIDETNRPAPRALSLVALASPAFAQSGDNVLLVVNDASADSQRIAEHYARLRGVPAGQLLRVKADATVDEIERDVFDAQIQLPIANWLRSHAAQDRILYLVLTKGIPLRVKGTPGRDGTVASVDSELTLLYRRLVGGDPKLTGPLTNPYYLGASAIGTARPFTHEAADIYLVTRLDGYTVDDVLKLVDRGAAPSREGRILLDQKATLSDAGGDRWLKATADWMTANGFGDRVVLDAGRRVLTGESNVLGYYSWGSNDPAITMRSFGFGFVPGAIAGTFVSTDGRTFREPPTGWTIGPWTDRTKFFANSPQSLAGDLIREGITGIAGHVDEPYLDATIRPNVLFPAYLSGFNLAESFYLAMPYVSWQTVVVGDPLCAPFPRKMLQPSDIDKGLDPATELPRFFSARRLQTATSQGVRFETAPLLLRAEARMARGDSAGAQKTLEEVTAIDPRLRSAHFLLATTYEQQREYDKAIARYRKILEIQPNDAVALNNLAYALAVRKGQPAEALGYAERAFTLSQENPTVGDTLAWVQHMLGRDREAAALLAAAAKALPANAEVRLHNAVVLAAVGMPEQAAKELQEALRLDPELAKSDEVKALQAKLRGTKLLQDSLRDVEEEGRRGWQRIQSKPAEGRNHRRVRPSRRNTRAASSAFSAVAFPISATDCPLAE